MMRYVHFNWQINPAVMYKFLLFFLTESLPSDLLAHQGGLCLVSGGCYGML